MSEDDKEEVEKLRLYFLNQAYKSSQFKDSEHRIWHYTTARGVLGIIESQRMWASNILFMNDPLELKRVYTRASEILANHIETSGGKDPVWHRIRVHVKPEPDFIKTGFPSAAFVASFTTNSNSPNHWALYSDQGRGVAMGFRTEVLGPISLQAGTPILPCVYDQDHLTEYCSKILDLMYKQFAAAAVRLPGSALPVFDTQFSNYGGASVGPMATLFKDENFDHEKEWRSSVFAYDPTWNNVKHRVAGDRIVPYVEVDLRLKEAPKPELIPIAEIVLGPSANEDLLRPALNSALEANGYGRGLVPIHRTPHRLRPS